MYTFIKSYVKKQGVGTLLEELDVSQVRIADLYREYNVVYLVLGHSMFPDVEYGFDAFQHFSNMSSDLRTVEQYLNDNGNNTLPTDSPAKTMESTWVVYNDANKQFSLRRTMGNNHPDNDYPFEDKRTLTLIDRDEPGRAYETLLKHRLFTVNGCLHRSEPSAHGIIVNGAVETMEHSRMDLVGCLEFDQVGEVKQIPITDGLYGKDANSNELFRRICFTLNESLKGKTVMLSFLGRLYYRPNVLRVVGDKSIVFDMEQINIGTLWQKIVDRIPLGSVPLGDHPYEKPYVINRAAIQTDAAIDALLKLPQTFLIVVDGELSYEYDSIPNQKLPGQYVSEYDINTPITGDGGLFLDYWKRYDWGKWVYSTPSSFELDYHHDTLPSTESKFISGAAKTNVPGTISAARALYLKQSRLR